jgi:hypothetical protein
MRLEYGYMFRIGSYHLFLALLDPSAQAVSTFNGIQRGNMASHEKCVEP